MHRIQNSFKVCRVGVETLFVNWTCLTLCLFLWHFGAPTKRPDWPSVETYTFLHIFKYICIYIYIFLSIYIYIYVYM